MFGNAYKQIKGVLADLASGIGALLAWTASSARGLARFVVLGVTALAIFAGRCLKRWTSGPKKTTEKRYLSRAAKKPFRLRLPGFRLLVLGTVSLGFWVAVAAIAINIRMASLILPTEVGDLYSANRPASMTILDRHGNVIGSRGAIFGDPVDIDRLPPIFIDALIATEDRRFFNHAGFDAQGLARAMVANLRAGGLIEGGSTITQQLAKNLFLTPEKSVVRKIEELQLAMWLEGNFTKEEILKLYVNRIYLGAGAYGVEAAANVYFSKPASELTDQEAILLAGLPQAPSSYAPTTNFAAAIARSHVVIDNLVETGKLTSEDAENLKANPAALNVQVRSPAHGYFLDHVVAELTNRLGPIQDDLVVTTTLDSALQQKAEDAVSSVMEGVDADSGATQASLIAFDDVGGIVAMVGGRDYEISQFNRATQALRQPGSAFKPFVYLAALESGLSADTVVIDRPVHVGDWQPTNYSEKFRGPMRLSTALADSTNTVAVQVTEAIGRDRVIDASQRAGIARPLGNVPSLALGAMEMTLADLTAGYMAFAHGGQERPAHAISSVRTRTGREMGNFGQQIDGFQIIESGHARETTRMLTQVVRSGTGRKARIPGWQVAGKTGTTNDWKDAWFVGFSAKLTAGVWVGNDRALPMDEVTGGTIPLDIWRNFMATAHENEPAEDLLTADENNVIEDVGRLSLYYSGLRSDLIDVIYGPPVIENTPWWQQPRRGPFAARSGTPTRVVGQAAPGTAPVNE